MSYYTGVGAETDAAPAVVPAQAPTVAQKTPSFTKQSLAIMGVTALPWIPVVGGARVGGKVNHEDGRFWGAALGFAFSFMTIRYINKQMAGNIT